MNIACLFVSPEFKMLSTISSYVPKKFLDLEEEPPYHRGIELVLVIQAIILEKGRGSSWIFLSLHTSGET